MVEKKEDDKKESVEMIKEITVGNQKIVLKEPLSKEDAELLAKEIKEAVKSEGEWSYSPAILKKIERITFNPGKAEVTIEQKQIEELKRNNDLLKNQLTDLSTKIDGLSKKEPEPKKEGEVEKPKKDDEKPDPKKEEKGDDPSDKSDVKSESDKDDKKGEKEGDDSDDKPKEEGGSDAKKEE